MKEKGVTLVEILLVVALLIILAILMYTGWRLQLEKARDAERVTELEQWTRALISYHEDKGCYPDENEMVCDSTFLQPYMDRIPCDPTNNGAYKYRYSYVDCNTFFIYSKLENEADEKITFVNCMGGCGPTIEEQIYNYFVSSPNVTVESGASGILPICGSGENLYCFPGVCSTCCPGVGYRCAPSGKLCFSDNNCQ